MSVVDYSAKKRSSSSSIHTRLMLVRMAVSSTLQGGSSLATAAAVQNNSSVTPGEARTACGSVHATGSPLFTHEPVTVLHVPFLHSAARLPCCV
jgi:hypothetical protein